MPDQSIELRRVSQDAAGGEFARAGAEMTPANNTADRLKRFVLRGVLDRLMPWVSTRSHGGIKCLCFHYVFPQDRDNLRRICDALLTLGPVITTKEILVLRSMSSLEDKLRFHISVDDGFCNVEENAHPIFKEFSIPYSIFICPTFISNEGGDATSLMRRAEYKKGLPVMGWNTLRSLARDGVEIGSHTNSHARLSLVSSGAMLRDEIVGSKLAIEAALQMPCISMAWPFGKLGDVTAAALTIAKEAGYEAIFGGVRGTINSDTRKSDYLPRHHFEPSWPLRTITYYATRRDRPFAAPR
jgi:hypothetical protein